MDAIPTLAAALGVAIPPKLNGTKRVHTLDDGHSVPVVLKPHIRLAKSNPANQEGTMPKGVYVRKKKTDVAKPAKMPRKAKAAIPEPPSIKAVIARLKAKRDQLDVAIKALEELA